MPDWNNADGMQLALLQEAVLHAFPNPTDLEMLLRLRLNRSYAQLVAGSANYRYAVFQILVTASAEHWLDRLIDAAGKQNPGNPRLRALRPMAELAQAATPAGDLALTNWHVVRRVLSGEKKPVDVALRFDYASDAGGTSPGVTHTLAAAWCLRHSPASALELGEGNGEPTPAELDYALLRLAQPIGDQPGPGGEPRGWITTQRATAIPAVGDVLFVLQHPQGDPLKLAIGVSRGANGNGSRVLHDANTVNGSSGSPCLNAKLELVALHNAGDPLYDGVIGAPQHNQAVPVEAILASVDSAGGPRFWSN